MKITEIFGEVFKNLFSQFSDLYFKYDRIIFLGIAGIIVFLIFVIYLSYKIKSSRFGGF